jgi:TPR repeat protein
VGHLIVDAKPRAVTRLEITDPQGQVVALAGRYDNPQAAPGTWKVLARAPGYEETSREVAVTADEVRLVELMLRPFGTLRARGGVPEARLKVTGPSGFSHQGGLPWESPGLPPGLYLVDVTRPGYASYLAEARVDIARVTTVRVELAPVEDGASPQPARSKRIIILPGFFRIEGKIDLCDGIETRERRCAEGDGQSCAILGRSYLDGGCELQKDERRAAELFGRACDGGSAAGCSGLGDCYNFGRCGLRPGPQAARLYEKACAKDEAHACWALGMGYLEGRGDLAKDARRAGELFRKACDAGGLRGCMQLARCYEVGHCGLAQDERRAGLLYQEACDDGAEAACRKLGLCRPGGPCKTAPE